MSNDNTQDGAEPSSASGGSHGGERRAAFERWADGDGGHRTIKKKNGSYLDGPTRWAWEGWQAATLTDEEREAIERLCEAVAEYSDIDRKANGCHADDDMAAVDVARGLLKRLT